jgi:multidrug efflux system membrane fusion protein
MGALPFPVEVAPVESRRVEYVVSAVGTVDAFERVQITARVPGVVERISFDVGDHVKTGQKLVEIEPQRYRLAVASARATSVRAEAGQADAASILARREAMAARDPGLVTVEEIDGLRTKARIAQADLAAARAALSRAALDLRDAVPKAPREGVIESRDVQTGQYVQPGAVLATLVQRDPLRLRFLVAEPDAGRLAPGQAVRFGVRDDAAELTARISFVSQTAEESSRMVPVLANIDDPSKDSLRPGAFAEVTVPVGSATDAPVVPQTAVRPSERGFLAYVVDAGKARERVLQLGMRTADGRVEVRSGLRVGEALVVRGAEALRDGADVSVAPPSAP